MIKKVEEKLQFWSDLFFGIMTMCAIIIGVVGLWVGSTASEKGYAIGYAIGIILGSWILRLVIHGLAEIIIILRVIHRDIDSQGRGIQDHVKRIVQDLSDFNILTNKSFVNVDGEVKPEKQPEKTKEEKKNGSGDIHNNFSRHRTAETE